MFLRTTFDFSMAYAAATSAISDVKPPQLPKRLDVLRAHHRSKQMQQPSVRASEVAQETSLMRTLHGAFLTALPIPPVVLAAATSAASAASIHPHVMEPSANIRSSAAPPGIYRSTPIASRKRRSMSPAASLPRMPQPNQCALPRAPQVSSFNSAPTIGLQNQSALSFPKRPLFEASQPQASFPFAVSFVCA